MERPLNNIGISGGKDSTIAAALLVRAFPQENVFGVLMPCGEQADIADSYKVVEYLHIPHVEVNIGQAMEKADWRQFPGGLFGKNEVYYTNTPARLRMIHRMVCRTWSVVESFILAMHLKCMLAYTTKFGDMAGDFSIFTTSMFVKGEILAMAMLQSPVELVHKAPGDGMTGNWWRATFGFSYECSSDAYLPG